MYQYFLFQVIVYAWYSNSNLHHAFLGSNFYRLGHSTPRTDSSGTLGLYSTITKVNTSGVEESVVLSTGKVARMMKLIHVHGYGNVGGAADWNLVVKVVLSLSNKLIASKQTELYLDKKFGL